MPKSLAGEALTHKTLSGTDLWERKGEQSPGTTRPVPRLLAARANLAGPLPHSRNGFAFDERIPQRLASFAAGSFTPKCFTKNSN